MPTEGWNGKFRGTGNGGFAGSIGYAGIATALRQDYATASTDTGHASPQGTDARWALGHPEKVTDFGYRGIHEMTRIAKAVIKAFYGSDPRRSYFGSCSNGGRQALMEAQRFPSDYDGILAGAPANFWTHLFDRALAGSRTVGGEGDCAFLDNRDEVRQGRITDARQYDPSTVSLSAGRNVDGCGQY